MTDGGTTVNFDPRREGTFLDFTAEVFFCSQAPVQFLAWGWESNPSFPMIVFSMADGRLLLARFLDSELPSEATIRSWPLDHFSSFEWTTPEYVSDLLLLNYPSACEFD